MRDFALLIMLLTLAGLVWRTPWLGVLALAFIGYMHPQGYAEGFLQGARLFAACFLLTVVAFVVKQREPWGQWLRDRLGLFRDWRLLAMIALWAWAAVTSYMALIPADAWRHWVEFTKVFATVGLTLLLIDDRRKLEALLLIIALAIGLVAVKGGYWALIHGAQDRVYGSPAGHFHDNNHFAVANLMAVPLLLYFWSATEGRAVRWLLGIVVAFGLIAVLSSWSRGGLLGLGATLLALAITSRRRGAVLTLLAGMAVAAVVLMPESWLERMQTITTPTEEASARGRLEFWRFGLELGAKRPLWGWGFGSDIPLTERAEWHSSYVQMFAEQGAPGSLLWLGLLGGTFFLLGRSILGRRRTAQADPQKAALSRALMASFVAYGVCGVFLGISYWDIFFHLIGVSVLVDRLPIGPGDTTRDWQRG